MCRHTQWPDNQHGYELDLIARDRLAQATRVMILEDETYTGGSIKELIRLCLSSPSNTVRTILIFTVADSMRISERSSLLALCNGISSTGTRLGAQTALGLQSPRRLLCVFRFGPIGHGHHVLFVASCPPTST